MSASDRNGNEKRDFVRMKIDSEVTIRQGDTDYQAVCKDLSGTGMLLQTTTAFACGDTVDVLIEQKSSGHDSFSATAEVSRVEDNGDQSYTVGLSIKEIR
ncbi:MAG: PilZ domain-containing protein [Oceanicoccus sp.]